MEVGSLPWKGKDSWQCSFLQLYGIFGKENDENLNGKERLVHDVLEVITWS